MVYNTRNFYVSGLYTLSGISKEHTMFWKLDLFPSSGKKVKKGGRRPLLGSLRKSFLPEDGNRSSFRNVVSSLEIPDDGYSPETYKPPV
jgi:hypothetical protein